MPVQTMTAANTARAGQAYTEWERTVPQIASQIDQLEATSNRVEGLYQIVRDNTDAATAAEYGADAGNLIGPLLSAKTAKVKAFLTWVAGAAGMSLNTLLDSLKDPE